MHTYSYLEEKPGISQGGLDQNDQVKWTVEAIVHIKNRLRGATIKAGNDCVAPRHITTGREPWEKRV